ncbi:MAG: DUF3794 domain-containing protein [Clostridia bacterium]|nr:DUF3794 domain-containing protein [Clostridia bacterium]
MNLYQNTEGMQIPLSDKTVLTEVAGDFSLPDYQPEIKRLLRIRPCVLPPSHYAGAGNAEFSGTLDYYVLYMGNDGGLYCAPLHTEYGISVPFDQGQATVSLCMADVVPDSVMGRVSAPRKLNIRCRLRSGVRIFGTLPAAEQTEGVVDPFSVERLQGEQTLAQMDYGVSDLVHLSEDILTDTRGRNMRLVCAEGQVHVQEATSGMGVINCRGEVELKLMMSAEEQGSLPDPVPTYLVRKLPFSGSIEVAGAASGSECCVVGNCAELSVAVEETYMHAEVGVVLQAHVMSNRPVRYTKDIFSTKKECECVHDEYMLPVAIRALNGNFTQSDSMPLAEAEIPAGCSIVDVCGSAEAEEMQWERGRCSISGTGHYVVLTYADSEVVAHEIALPWKYEFECTREPKDWRAHVQVLSSRARVDGERIGIDAEIACAVEVWDTAPARVLRSVSFGEAANSPGSAFVVCYPSAKDSLWSVAKRYATSLSAVRNANDLGEESPADTPASIEGCKYLIV